VASEVSEQVEFQHKPSIYSLLIVFFLHRLAYVLQLDFHKS